MKTIFNFFIFHFFLLPVIAQQSVEDIIVYPNKTIHKINPDFWGVNFLYWIEDDSALASGNLLNYLKEANVTLLRYPGGTVADNFHWRTATLDNTNMFPFESGHEETNFDEFMTASKAIGTEVSCVLNTESWFVKNDIEGGAQEAAEWLRYCKKKGYKVKYWEIGNETYWHPIMTAEEYAHLVNIYVDSMRNIDPEVVLGINGHWDINFSGTKERIDPAFYSTIMNNRNNIISIETYKAYQEFTEKNIQFPITSGRVKWWETLANLCGDKVDMIIIHWYFGEQQLPIVSKKILEIRELFAKYYPDKNYLFNMSEFNTVSNIQKGDFLLVEMLGEILKGKIDVACLWPLTLNIRKPMFLKYPLQIPTSFYNIYKKLSADLKGNLVLVDFPENITGYASSDEKSSCIVISGRQLKKTKSVNVIIDSVKYKKCFIWRITKNNEIYEQLMSVTTDRAELKIEEDELVILKFED